MSEDLRTWEARRPLSFGQQAGAYAEHRADYPAAAIEWALEPVRERPGLRVLDLAAGTGKLAQGLLALDLDVVAVEPDEAMLAQLRLHLPAVPAHLGSAEEIPLPDDSVDAVLVGQAMHWFDMDQAFGETERVLRTGGVLAALWNGDDDRVDWVRELWRISRNPSLERGVHGEHAARPVHPHFGRFEDRTFDHTQPRTAESLTATVSTQSHVLLLEEDDRADLLRRVHTYLESVPEVDAAGFDLPLRTLVARSVHHG